MANVVLLYHNIAQHGQCILFNEWSPFYDVSRLHLEAHLNVMARCANRILLTFDDCYKSMYQHVLPLMEKFPSQQYACFITTGAIGEKGMLAKNEIRTLAENRVRIGAHSHNHVFLEKLGAQQFDQQLLRPKKILEDITGGEISELSLPGGRYGQRTLEFAARCGYRKIYTSMPGTRILTLAELPGIELVPRWAVTSKTTVKEIERIIHLESRTVLRRKTHFLAGKLAKRLFGHRVYHALWQKMQLMKRYAP